MTTIMDPTDERVPVNRTVTPRPETISGRVAFLDISKPRGNVLIDRLETLMAQRLPDVTCPWPVMKRSRRHVVSGRAAIMQRDHTFF